MVNALINIRDIFLLEELIKLFLFFIGEIDGLFLVVGYHNFAIQWFWHFVFISEEIYILYASQKITWHIRYRWGDNHYFLYHFDSYEHFLMRFFQLAKFWNFRQFYEISVRFENIHSNCSTLQQPPCDVVYIIVFDSSDPINVYFWSECWLFWKPVIKPALNTLFQPEILFNKWKQSAY